MPRRTPEDLIFPERVFFRMISDYTEGRLHNTRNQLFKRAIVVDVDTVGGQLEARPPNPAGSIRARVYTSGLDATTPNSALTIFHPMFPAHVRPPVERDEHVLVVFEDPDGMSNGLWITTVPAYRDINFRDPEEDRTSQPTTGDRFEGNPASSTEVNRDLEFGGLTEEAGVREEIINSFESGIESLFEGKKILHIGDGNVQDSYGNEIRDLVQERGASQYISEGRVGWGVPAWVRGRLSETGRGASQATLANLIEQNNPDLVMITLGIKDVGNVDRTNYEDQVAELWAQATQAPMAVWVGPPLPTGPNSRQISFVDRIVVKIRQTIGSRFVDSRDITGPSGRKTNGLDFTTQGGQDWARLIINRIERSF